MAVDPGALTPPPRPTELAALAAGMWSLWRGLDPLPTTDEVAEQLGEPLEPHPHSGMFGGSPTVFRRYSLIADAPLITVWFEGDIAVGVEIDDPSRSLLDDPLGAPDEILDSEVGELWEQHIYGDNGLVLHVRTDDHGAVEARLLYGLPPFDPEAFHEDPLRWAGRRERFRR
jgi:hypothetical protein